MTKPPPMPDFDVPITEPPNGRLTAVWWEWLQRFVRWDEETAGSGGDGGGGSGAVSSVTGVAPVVVSGSALLMGDEPHVEAFAAGDVTVSMPAATGSNSGHLTSSDWTTFFNKAPLVSPAFTGTPTAPTPTAGDADTSIATTAFVQSAIVTAGSFAVTVSDAPPSSPAPGKMWLESDTGTLFIYWQDPNSSQWVDVSGSAALGNYLPLAGGTMTGLLTLSGAPTATLHAATKAYVDGGDSALTTALALKANLTGATFTSDITTYRSGTPTTGVVFLGNTGARYLFYNGTNYEMPGAALTLGGNLTLAGGAVFQTDGNLYMPWAATHLSTYFANYALLAGAAFTGAVQIAGGLYNEGAPTTAAVANAHISNADGNHFYRNNSSLAYKTAVEPLAPEYGDKILALKPIFYRGNEKSADDPAWSWFGFSAENCDAVDFRFCSYTVADKDKGEGWTKAPLIPENIHTHGILAALVNLVQRQEKRIRLLEAANGHV